MSWEQFAEFSRDFITEVLKLDMASRLSWLRLSGRLSSPSDGRSVVLRDHYDIRITDPSATRILSSSLIGGHPQKQGASLVGSYLSTGMLLAYSPVTANINHKPNRWLKKCWLESGNRGVSYSGTRLSKHNKNGLNPTFSLCEQKAERIDHLVSVCWILTPIEYKETHDKIENYIHWKICEYYGILKSEILV